MPTRLGTRLCLWHQYFKGNIACRKKERLTEEEKEIYARKLVGRLGQETWMTIFNDSTMHHHGNERYDIFLFSEADKDRITHTHTHL